MDFILIIQNFPGFSHDELDKLEVLTEQETIMLKAYKRKREADGLRDLERALRTFEKVNNLDME